MTWYHKTCCAWPNRACGARPNRAFLTGLLFTNLHAIEASPVRPSNNKLCWARVQNSSHVCNARWMPVTLKSVLKPQLLPALYQTKPQHEGIMLTSVTWLAAKSETVDTGSTFRAGSNTLSFAKYFASGIGEDNAGAEMTKVSTCHLRRSSTCSSRQF